MKTQKISGKVIKVGRKWIKIVQDGRNEKYPEDLLINELTSGLKTGDIFKDLTVETTCEYQYKGGYKYTHTAISEDTIKKAEIDKWWGYIKNKYENSNQLYQKGVYKLHELGCHEYDNEILQMGKNIEIANAIFWIRYNFSYGNYIYAKGIDILKKYNIHEYDDEINEMREKIAEKRKSENDKYIRWNDNADEHSRIDNGVIVVKGNIAIKVISSKYCDGENAGYPWDVYEYKGIDVTETEEGKKAIEDTKERMRELNEKVENQKKKNDLIARIRDIIKSNDILNAQEIDIPQGQKIIDTFDIYGSGYCIINDGNYAWYIINNGRDGDFWERNHIHTGGAGAYGYKCDIILVLNLLNELEKMEEI